MDIFHLIVYVTVATVLIPLMVAIIQWKKIPAEVSGLRWLLIASLICDLAMIKMASLSIPNQWIGDVFMFIQCILLLYIFSIQFSHKKLFISAAILVVALYSASFLFPDYPIAELVSSGTVDSFILIMVSIAFFYKLLNELKVTHIHRLPILWISFAALFYYSGNLFVFLASRSLEGDPDAFMITWSLHNILTVIKNMLLAVALWQSYRALKTANG